MKVENSVLPNQEQMQGFAEPSAKAPIYMLNLLKYKENAEYSDGRHTRLSGAEAYRLYGDAVSELIVNFGGQVTFTANVERMALGEVEELWDEVAIAMYPSRQAMAQMMMSEEMQDIGEHRKAGLAGQLNIELNEAYGAWLSSRPFQTVDQ